MLKKLLLLPTFFILFALTPLTVDAQEASDIESTCVQINNGGDTCFQSDTFTINKKVLSPTAAVITGQTLQDAAFIDNTDMKAPFTPANTLTAFRLYITNTSNNDLQNITVVDRLPAHYLTYVTSEGKYNEKDKTTTFTIASLPSGQTRAFTIQIMTAMGTLLPSDPVCVTNQARVTVTNERFSILPDEVKESQDNARLCITKNETDGTPVTVTTQQSSGQPNPTTTKGGLPVVSPTPTNKTPETGAESLILIGLLPAGALGFLLRRKAK